MAHAQEKSKVCHRHRQSIVEEIFWFGRAGAIGLDDLTKASNPELLQLLGKVMVAADFDLREFQRVILNSKAYQAVSSVSPSSGDSENYLFPGPILRRMSAEQAWDSILALVLGTSLDDYKVDRSNRVTRYDFHMNKQSRSSSGKSLMKKNGYLKSNQRIVEMTLWMGSV